MIEPHDNNNLYGFAWNLPLKKMAVGLVESLGERMFLHSQVVHENILLCPVKGALKGLDIDSLQTLWEIRDAGVRNKVCDNHLYTTLGGKVACINLSNLEIIWRTEDEEFLRHVYRDFVYTSLEEKPYPMRCRDKVNGKLVWESEIRQSSQLIFSGDYFVSAGNKYHYVNCNTGEVSWNFDTREWLENNIFTLGLEYPEILTDSEKYGVRVGPLVNGTLYLMPRIGSIAAIDAQSGRLKGTVVVPTGEIENPHISQVILSLIFKDGKLFFHRSGFKQQTSYIFGALDAESGTVLFTKEFFSREVGGWPGSTIMVGRYYITTVESNYLVVFDTEKQEVVWEYKTEGQERNMMSTMVPYENGLIFGDQEQYVHRFQGRD